MDIEEWKDYAKEHNGNLLAWVDQTSSLKIKKATVDGVCFTMSLDFVLKFQEGGTSPFYFLNSIKAAASASNGKNNVPDVYVIKQNLYMAELAASKKRADVLIQQIQAAEIAHKVALGQQLKDLNQLIIRNRYGGDKMKAFEFFDADFILTFCDILNTKMDDQVTANGPSYFLAGMNKPGSGGHVVAFSQRADMTAGPKFPGIYEFFDANLGFFVFPSKQDLAKFFADCVCVYYMSKDYSKFSLASYIASGNKRQKP